MLAKDLRVGMRVRIKYGYNVQYATYKVVEVNSRPGWHQLSVTRSTGTKQAPIEVRSHRIVCEVDEKTGADILSATYNKRVEGQQFRTLQRKLREETAVDKITDITGNLALLGITAWAGQGRKGGKGRYKTCLVIDRDSVLEFDQLVGEIIKDKATERMSQLLRPTQQESESEPVQEEQGASGAAPS